ncbi:MAG TPA: diaminopimelate decarboxylase [Myxococcota bacterium]|nr:diaminopimelate decarboxylase [Myxococcota bacterium]
MSADPRRGAAAASGAFTRRDGVLLADEVRLDELAERFGTPLFVYSATALASAYDALDRALADVPHTLCYSIKTNMNLAVVRTLVARGAGVDVTSGGELYRALRAGASSAKIVYSGVGKRDDEIDLALAAGIKMFNVESRAELRRIDAVAAARGVRAPVAFRVNPDVDPKTHPYISTGLRTSKFGIPWGEAVEAYAEAKALEHVEAVGIDCHIGSQLTRVQPFVDALNRVRHLLLELRDAGHEIRTIDVGGGLGVTYDDETPPSFEEYARGVLESVGGLGCDLVFEPGRSFAANAGVLLTRVLYEKTNEDKRFVIVDAAMNDLIRPALYQAFQRIEPVGPARGEPSVADVVGPVCESGDFLARDRPFPPVETGDLLAVHSAGAYGFSMSSNYNGRVRAAEVLVKGAAAALVRERESYEDLVRGETIPEEITG